MGKATAARRVKIEGLGPTREQERQGTLTTSAEPNKDGKIVATTAAANFVAGGVTEQGVVVGRAYRRLPWFETLAKRDQEAAARERPVRKAALDAIALHALRFYRNAHEAAARSETRCALDIRPRGGGVQGEVPPMLYRARRQLAACEVGMGGAVHALRAVALHDMSYANVAMQRYGSRDVDMILDGRNVTKPAPKSGRHPTLIREEFEIAVALLIRNVQPMVASG